MIQPSEIVADLAASSFHAPAIEKRLGDEGASLVLEMDRTSVSACDPSNGTVERFCGVTAQPIE